MKPFEFFFEGTPRNSDNTVRAGIKVLSGEPLEIGLTLGLYASQSLRELKDNAAATIVCNAFKKFIELNPEMTETILKGLMGDEAGTYTRIIKPNFKMKRL
jgi:hypothetical protein